MRGQLSVCVILGVFYAAALWAIGLQYGVLVGLIAGLISFIPYIGSTVGLLLSVGIALFQFWDAKLWIVVTAGIFLFGQFVEGNILAPNLIGKSVGLHPVWLILALAVFGSLFGFTGLLVAVPVAAALGVIGRFLVEQYLASPMYTGRVPPEDRALSRPEQLVLDLPTRPALGRAAFYVAPANRLALALVDSWPAWPGGRLAVTGPAGSGKTHLAHVWAARAGAGILAARDVAGLDLATLPGDAAVAVEDVDRLAGLRRAGGGRGGALPPVQPPRRRGRQPDGERAAPPSRWTIRLPDLASRMAATTVARLEAPDDALLAALLVKHFADRQVAVGPGLIDYLVPRIERSSAAAEAVVAALDRAGLAGRRPLTPRLAAEVLQTDRGE